MAGSSTLAGPLRRCKHRSAQEMHQQWLDFYTTREGRDWHESMYISQPFTKIIRDSLPTSEHRDFHLYGDRECPTKLASDDAPVQERAHCPWFNVINNDRKRYPNELTEARCKCDRCLGVDGLSQCEPVYYNVHVLLRTEQCDGEGYYKWQSGWQKISVGCTCARTPTV